MAADGDQSGQRRSTQKKAVNFQDRIARQHEFVSARFPLAVEVFGIVILDLAIDETQTMCVMGAKAQLPVIAKCADNGSWEESVLLDPRVATRNVL